MEKIESLLDSAAQTSLTIGVTLLTLRYSAGDAAGHIKVPDVGDIAAFFAACGAFALLSGVVAGIRKAQAEAGKVKDTAQ